MATLLNQKKLDELYALLPPHERTRLEYQLKLLEACSPIKPEQRSWDPTPEERHS